jgi:zinc protease
MSGRWCVGRLERLVLALGLFLAPAMEALPARAAGIEVDTFQLNNGMQVVVIPDHRAPVVTHMVWYKIGSADEPVGLSGVAHFLEHLMFKRTKNLEDGEFSKIVAENGGQHNAFTSYDVTAYYQSVAKDRLPLMMKIEADRMANLNLKPADIAAERDVIIEERRLRIENNPSALLGEQMMAALYLAHPYGTPVIGWKAEMEALSYDAVMDFYAKHYTPSSAILIVAGDVTADEVRALAEKTYGRHKGREVEPRQRRAEPAPIAARRLELVDSRVRQPSWDRIYLAPSYNRGAKEHAPALAVLAQIMGGGATSRLYRRLVVDEQTAVDAGAYYSGSYYDLGQFGIYAVPPPEFETEAARERMVAVEASVERVLADLLNEGVTEAELERAKRRLLASEIYARDNLMSMAQIFGRALTAGLTIEDVLAWPDKISAVTVADVQAAARTVLRPEGSVTGLLFPKPAQPAPAAPVEGGQP